MGGFLLGSVTALLLNLLLTEQQVAEWGWRIPFLIAGPLGIVGLIIRSRLEESPEFVTLQSEGQALDRPLRATITLHWRSVLVVAAFALYQNVAVYVVLTFMSSYFVTTLGYDVRWSSFSAVAALVVLCAVVPFTGALSDRIGRKKVLATSCGAAALLTYPLFLLIDQGSVVLAAVAYVALGFILGAFLGPVLTAMSELFSTDVRYGGMSLGYNISVSLFGGTAPFVVTALIAGTGLVVAPSFYLIAAAVVTFGVVIAAKETAPRIAGPIEASGELNQGRTVRSPEGV
jgi:MHS family proline/betaine transporter-like MFS transporter